MPLTIEEKRQAISSAWLMQDTPEVPFIVEVGESHYATEAFLADMPADLAAQEAHWQTLAGLDDYAIPNLKPNLGIGVVAAAFGCEWVPDPRRDPWIKPLIGDHNPEAVRTLAMPAPGQSGVTALAGERIAYLQEHSVLPLRLVNVPSPLVTASLIWEYGSFPRSTVLHPREVHALLETVTEATIRFVRWQLQCIESLFALTHEPWYMPAGLGIRISDDTAAVMSPVAYRRFGIPYNAMIARAFGGIVLHSCGSIGHVLPAMLETPDLRGIDLVAPQNDLRKTRDIVQGQVPLCLRYYGWDFLDQKPGSLLEYSRELLECFGRRGILLWSQADTFGEAKQLCAGLQSLTTA